MFIKQGANVNFATRGGVTVLMQAINVFYEENVLELIIKSGVDVNAPRR